MGRRLRAKAHRHAASVEAYQSAPGWMRGDPGTLVAECVIRCGRCDARLAAVHKRMADGYRDGVLLTRGGPLPTNDDGTKARFRCRCGATPEVRIDRLSAVVDGSARPGERTSVTVRVA